MPDTLFQLASLSLSDKLWVVVCLGVIILLVWISVYFILIRRQAARETILLDAGLDRDGGMYFLFGILIISISLAMLWDVITLSGSLLGFLRWTFNLLAGVLFLYTGTLPTLLTANGIFSLRGYFPWGNIHACTWNDQKNSVLVLQLNRLWFFQHRARLHIPPRHRRAVQAILELKAGKGKV